jgi:hypothetical protein
VKKPVVLSAIVAVLLLTWAGPAHPQDSAKDDTPTFYRLVPGTYVNGWPRFTIRYPKDWVEQMPSIDQQVFRAAAPNRASTPALNVGLRPSPLPLDKYGELAIPWFRNIAKDVTIVSDRASQLEDGTPAREIELQMILNGRPYNTLFLATKKGDLFVSANVGLYSGRVGKDLKAILYTLQFSPGHDEPVRVPPDVQEFLDTWCHDIVSHDVAKVMSHYSERSLDSGRTKGWLEPLWKQWIGPVTSFEVSITDFVPAKDRAHLTGFMDTYFGRQQLTDTIIKENGEWKWYGNQRNPAP